MLDKLGEIIEASTAEFTVECYELYAAPALGSLIKTSDGDVEMYGVVYNTTTESMDPGRKPLARGKDEKDEADIYRSSPQLSVLFRTNFNAFVIGHKIADDINRYLPPRPARIHSFVYELDEGEIQAFTKVLDFLYILATAPVVGSNDEVVAACLRNAAKVQDDTRSFLIGAGKELAVLLSAEPHRLEAILRRIRP
ncbi:hypothetical protein ACFLVR_01075 [Chloroflexota bacterium]